MLNSRKRLHVSVVCSPARWQRAERVRTQLERGRSIEILHREFIEAALFRGARLEVTRAALEESAREGWGGTAREGRHSAWVSVALWDWAEVAAEALSAAGPEVRRSRLAGALVGAMGDLRQEDAAQEIANLRLAQLSGG